MKTILKVVVGSTLHGLNTPNSDIDTRGIFQVPLIDIVSPFKKQQNTSWIEGKVDDTSYELLNFIKFACQGNPTILEVLWSDMVKETSTIGESLRENRYIFLDSERIYQAHRGYSHNQLNKMDLYNPNKIRTPKTVIAYIRSMRQGAQLLRTGTFDTKYNYPDKQFLMDIKEDFKPSHVSRVSELMLKVSHELELANRDRKEMKPDFNKIEELICNYYGIR